MPLPSSRYNIQEGQEYEIDVTNLDAIHVRTPKYAGEVSQPVNSSQSST